jgi:hypothetical protein
MASYPPRSRTSRDLGHPGDPLPTKCCLPHCMSISEGDHSYGILAFKGEIGSLRQDSTRPFLK